jgi:hypothetical protein
MNQDNSTRDAGSSVPACSDADSMKHDLEFIANMLMEVVIVQQKRDDFFICEAWEVAKKYRLNAQWGVG